MLFGGFDSNYWDTFPKHQGVYISKTKTATGPHQKQEEKLNLYSIDVKHQLPFAQAL